MCMVSLEWYIKESVLRRNYTCPSKRVYKRERSEKELYMVIRSHV